jgi:hypothetical protein
LVKCSDELEERFVDDGYLFSQFDEFVFCLCRIEFAIHKTSHLVVLKSSGFSISVIVRCLTLKYLVVPPVN